MILPPNRRNKFLGLVLTTKNFLNLDPSLRSNYDKSSRIGTSMRHDFSRAGDQPGPGNYEIKPKITGPSFGFGSGSRPPLNPKNETPGPGGYNIS